MDADRFEALAEAYGGDIRRWPQAERTAAQALLAQDPTAQAMLAAAGWLDAAMDDWRVGAPSAALRERIIEGAPRQKRARPSIGLWLWLSGAGFAAVAVAGVMVGIAASDAALYDVRADQVLSAAWPGEAGPVLGPYTLGAAGSARA